MFPIFIFIALGYLIGSFPSAVVVAKVAKKDIFHTGSGNMGSMNTLRNVGIVPGIVVLLFDIGKGALATFLALWLTTLAYGEPSLIAALAALIGAVLGHAYSIYVRFKGGKALAVTFGTTLPLFPMVGIYALLLLIGLLLITKRADLSSVLTVIAVPVLMWFTLQKLGAHSDVVFLSTTATVVIVPIILSRYWLAARATKAAKTTPET